ncbi:MAG: ChbG/HpnK family deacetylase [Acidobacteria bacterium]|nr:ChbG/HpnK family deacetylase [Acidobacteriota bacterium]
MLPRLIVNADDFGLTPGINRAIAELHTLGALTSATLMANGPAFTDAVRTALAHPTLAIGCHIVLTDGTPLSPPHTIPTLLAPDGIHLRPSLADFFLSASRGKISSSDITREAHAQIARLQQHGIHPSHIDTHKHTHILPQIARPLLAVAESTGIRAIRNPFEPAWCPIPNATPYLRRLQLRLLHQLHSRFLTLPQICSRAILTTDGTLGVAATGSLDSTALRSILAHIPSGTWELVCHPGYNDPDLAAIPTRLRSSRDIERIALLEALSNPSTVSPNPRPFQSINYKDLL